MAIALLGLDRLPPGPPRDFFEAVHDLYDLAGQPGARVISAGIRRDHDLAETVSHETVSAVLRGTSLPSWAKVHSIVVELARHGVGRQDREAWVARTHNLWLRARAAMSGTAVGVDTRVSVQTPTRATLSPVTVTAAPPLIVAPRQPEPDGQIVGGLPERNPSFVGRELLLERMRADLEANAHAPLVLYGIGGVGKTQLAREYVHQFGHHYDVIWWVPADRAERARMSMVSLADRLRVPDHNNTELTALGVLSVLESRQISYVIVFDGVEDGEMRRLMPTTGGHVIVTTRDPGWAYDSSSVGLEVPDFDPAEAIQFLRRRDNQLTGQQADELATAFGRLPLVLEHVSALHQASGQSWAEIRAMLRDRASELFADAPSSHYPQSVGASLRLALERLTAANPMAAMVFELFAWLGPEPVSVWLLRAGRSGGVSPALARALHNPVQLNKAVVAICQLGLARLHHDSQRIEVQPVTRLALLDALGDDASERARRNVQEILTAADPGWPDDLPSWDMYREMAAHILPAGLVESRVGHAQHAVLHQIRYRYLVGEFEDAGRLARAAVTAWGEDDFLGPDNALVWRATRELANSLRALGQHEEARRFMVDLTERLRANAEYGEDHEETLATATGLAGDLRIAGEYREALRTDEDAQRRYLAQWGGADQRTIDSGRSLAASLRLNGDFAGAAAIDSRVLDHVRTTRGDRHRAVQGWVNALAEDLYGLGRYSEVVELQQHQREAGGRLAPIRELLLADRMVALARGGLGELGDAEGALRMNYHSCVESLGDDHEFTLAATVSYANVLRQRNLVDEAHVHATDAVSAYRRTFGPLNPLTLAAEVNLAAILRASGERNRARQADTAAHEVLRASVGERHPFFIAVTANLASDHALLGDHEGALMLAEQAYALALEVRGPTHPDTLAVAANLVIDRRAVGDGDGDGDTEHLLGEVLGTLRRTLGTAHPTVFLVASGLRVDLVIEPPSN
jgi:hypothetical protein